ncbi:MAG: hypothetical protein ACYC1P_05145 [Gaiellaceae bacterium]
MWDSNQLVLFLVLLLFYSAYFMLRFSIEDGPRRANASAVYALFGVALIPVRASSRSGWRTTSSTRRPSPATGRR